jgi:hypothetical protein
MLPNDGPKVAGGPFGTRMGTHLAAPVVHDFGPGNQTRPWYKYTWISFEFPSSFSFPKSLFLTWSPGI